MTFTIEKRKTSSPFKLSRAKKLFRRSFTGIGLLTVACLILLAFNGTVRNGAANALSNWAAPSTNALAQEFVLAPFEFEETHDANYVASIPAGTTKLPMAAISNLPVLELSELTPQQVKVTNWIANRYRVAPEMVALLVQEAWSIGERSNLDPTLFLAIIAIESRYNPYAQSTVGATGLMQVMTNVHAAKFERTGGAITVFDPVTNLRVGTQVLQEHVKRAGSLEGGLKQYVGATGPTDYGYAAKVLKERDRIRQVIFGQKTPTLEAILQAGRPHVNAA